MTEIVAPADGSERPAVRRPLSSPLDFVPWLARAWNGDQHIDEIPIDTVEEKPTGVLWMTGRGRRFAATASWTPAAEPLARWDVELEIVLISADATEAGIGVDLRLGEAADPHWLVPGLFYGENRPAESRARYLRWAPAGGDRFTAPRWSFRSDRAATPAVLATATGVTAALATTETSALGPTGLSFGGGGSAGPVEIGLRFPYREEPVVYDGAAEPKPRDLPSRSWIAGERVRLSFRVYLPDRPSHSAIVRDLHAWLSASSPVARWVSIPDAAALAAEGLLRWHYHSDESALYETAAFGRSGDGSAIEPGDRRAMHVAWLSGAPTAAALLAHGRRTGDANAIDAGRRVLDAIATNLAPCRTFWGQWSAENGWGKGWTPGVDALHARTIGEATLFMTRAASSVEPDDARVWRAAVASNLRFIIDRQADDGRIPSAWNGRTGEVQSWADGAGLAWVPALVEGAALLGESTYLDSARRAGTAYAYALDGDFLFGAPEDVDLGPTSEDGYVAVMAYVALAEAANDEPERQRWLALATRAADWMLTFRFAYDVAFEPDTPLGRFGYRSRGADLASPANQHLHTYGLICVGELVRLTRLGGDRHYLLRARESLAAARQFIARHDGDFGARRGMAPERFFQTRYGGPKGSIGPLSHAWCLGLLLWACDAAADLPELGDPDGEIERP